MKIKRKGKVYPSSSSSSSSYKDAISVFKLLPATILALASALSVDDREVLAYMITRSITTANPSSIIERHKKKCKTPHNVQKLPLFECGCFDCYISFWFRWDSSPDRELIHHAIEAFEDQLTTTEFFKKNGRGRKRDKLVGRRDAERSADLTEEIRTEPNHLNDVILGPDAEDPGENDLDCDGAELNGGLEMEVVSASAPASHHKGLARKVLPDVVGLLNSRLWSLWSPNI